MNANTPNTTTPSYNAEAPMASSKAMVTSPRLATKPNMEHLYALNNCFLAILGKKSSARWNATVKLNEVIKKEKKMVMEMKKQRKEEKEDDNITTTAVTTVAPTASQILVPQVAHQTSPGPLGTAKSSTPMPAINRKVATTDKVKKAPRSKTPRKILQRSQHRSMRTTELAQKSGQGRLTVASTAPEEGAAMTGPVKKIIEGLSAHTPPKVEARVMTKKDKEGPVNAGIKANSPTLKPRASAGVTKKKAIVGGLRGRIAGKAKGKGGIKGVEGQSIATATTTNKATKGPRTRTPPKMLRSPQRRSARIIESMQKSGREEGKSAVAALVEGRKVSEAGSRRLIAVAVLVNVKSPILKPKAGAGVPKREGKGGKVRRVKTLLGKDDASPKSINKNGRSPAACQEGAEEVAARDGSAGIVKKLLGREDIDPEVSDT
ncbi:hypothetical protein B9Z19DRAFT_1120098 [Tuber borchii]|uniref:Uncharacterized protein n=1 Tax=Tuber borchii TaxID=42251 RepID=A0A2T7A554_TUBBO|nr:hypothetical protein B9Z19DRAFT_1120098 [Tuber borchii]